MKKLMMLLIIIGLAGLGCANTGRYNTQKGAAIGAGLGALAGQAIGNDTRSTLIGTGVGTLLGTIVGNGIDQQEDEYRSRSRQYEHPIHHSGAYESRYYGHRENGEAAGCRQPPPGRWVMVPGHWEGRRWIPAHEIWMPVNPR
ncbi:MAG: YMGG-like glycine zipper-containing protein [Desulfobacterales bacterium]